MADDSTYPESDDLSDEDRIAQLNAFFTRIYPGGVFGIKTVGTQRKLYFSLPKYNIDELIIYVL